MALRGGLLLGAQYKPLRRQAACRLATNVVPPSDTPAIHIARQFEQEVVVEGLLHITAVQAGSCLERYGDLDSFTRSAPAPSPLASALTESGSGSSQLFNEAVCLAMPPDNPAGEQHRVNSIMRQVPRSISSEARCTQEVEELVNLEVQACQRTAVFNMYTQEVLQASAAISRQRRKALLRALRASRDTSRSMLQGSAALLESLMSRDDCSVGEVE